MSSLILVPLSIVAWMFTLMRLRAILLENVRQVGEIALNIWLMLLFFSLTLTFMVAEFAAFFNAYTFPNLSLLISHSSVLITAYFGAVTSLGVIGVPISKQIIHWIRALLVVVLIALLSIYILFVSKMPASLFFAPQNLPEVVFKFITCSFGTILSLIMAITHLVYLPSKKFALMRFRGTVIILAGLCAGVYLSIRAMIFGAYFWPMLMSPMLVTLSYVFLICSVLSIFLALLSNRIYARFVVLLRSLESWRAFQDLQCLVKRLLVLCPVIGMPPEYPSFWRFVFNPEYYLYRAVIIILDSKAMLVDFLAEVEKPGMGGLWEDDEHAEARRISAALEAANPSNDFNEIVETYRRVSRELFANQTPTGKLIVT